MQKKECVKIKQCRLCNSKNLNSVLDFGKTPLANSYKKNKNFKNKKYPLKVNLCSSCGHLQLGHSISPKKMFVNYLYQTNTSKKNYIHFKKYAAKASKLFIKKQRFKVLDIASNDGTFLKFFDKKNFRLGVDPAKNLKKIAKKKGINQIDKFFTYRNSLEFKKKYGSFDLITANHVCAHVENLQDFFKGVKNLLKENGYFIFEVSYRGEVLKRNTFDIIYHEHLDYHALKPIKDFAKKFDLKIFDFEITEAQGGSLRVYLSKNKTKNVKKISNFINNEKKILKLFNKQTFLKFEKNIIAAKNKLHLIINNAKKQKLKIGGYGAAAKTTTLLNFFKIEDNQINFIIDDNKLKEGLYMPGRNIKIVNYSELDKNKVDILIIFAWNYSEYIIKKIKNKNNLTKFKGVFLIPFPNPKIIK